MPGPLQGLKVIEFGGIGPGPFCAMMLADMGAEVIRLDRKADKGKDRGAPGFLASGRRSVLHRGRRSVAVDLKDAAHRDKVLAMIDGADAVIEGYRPGVLERLGLGPDVLLARNPKLVIGRMTGWGQDGPLAQAAGHDINYIALSGALSDDRPLGRRAGGAGGDGRRPGWWRHDARLRHRLRFTRSAHLRPWPSGRCRDHRRCGAADLNRLRPQSAGNVEERAAGQPVGRWIAFLRHLRVR